MAVPVREFRGALIRPFASKGMDVGVNVLIASGYGGQTLETLALPGEGLPFERITGLPSNRTSRRRSPTISGGASKALDWAAEYTLK